MGMGPGSGMGTGQPGSGKGKGGGTGAPSAQSGGGSPPSPTANVSQSQVAVAARTTAIPSTMTTTRVLSPPTFVQQFFKLEITSKMPFFMPESVVIAIVKSADVLNNDIEVTSIVAPENVPQKITVRFTRSVPEGDIETEEVNQAAVGLPAAIAFASAIVGLLGIVVLWKVEEIGPLVKTIATEAGSAVRFSAIAIIALVAGSAFFLLKGAR